MTACLVQEPARGIREFHHPEQLWNEYLDMLLRRRHLLSRQLRRKREARRNMQKWKAHVANATVQLQGLGGRGVVVTGGFILTATHCIRWDGSGGMTLGNHYSEIVNTKGGDRFRVGISAADPVSDMAAPGRAGRAGLFRRLRRFREMARGDPPCTRDERDASPRRFVAGPHPNAQSRLD